MIKLKSNSWHAKCYLGFYGEKPSGLPKDFCSYFWWLFLSLVTLTVVVILVTGLSFIALLIGSLCYFLSGIADRKHFVSNTIVIIKSFKDKFCPLISWEKENE